MGKRRNDTGLWRTAPIVLGVAALVCETPDASATPVLFWNQTMQSLELSAPAPNPPSTARDLSILNVAMYDAVNAALGSPQRSFYPTGPVPTGASAEAAADGAAHTYLLQRFPTKVAQIDAAYQSQLALLPSNAATIAGLTLGQNQATAALSARTGDGSATPSSLVPKSGPGQWQPTPPANAPFGSANWANVTPFTMSSPSEFRAAPPPELTSPTYAAAVSQVETLGAATSAARTLDQTKAAEFWDALGPGGVALAWNNIALQVAGTRPDSLLGDALTFALLSTAQTDAFIGAADSKVAYSFSRPVTAITSTTDPTWTPLLAAQAHPSYVSNHMAAAEAGAAILDAMFGEDGTAFSLTYDTGKSFATPLGNPTFGPVTREFNSFDQAAAETGLARIWGGVHFSFDVDAARIMGDEIAANG